MTIDITVDIMALTLFIFLAFSLTFGLALSLLFLIIAGGFAFFLLAGYVGYRLTRWLIKKLFK